MANLFDIHRETRDNLGNQDENKNLILLGPFNENVGTEMGPTQARSRDIGTAFIIGHPDNGILGISALGEGTMTAWAIQRVVNPNNVFHEHFRFSNFDDTTKTTGTFSTTNFNVSLTGGQIFQTLDIFKDSKSIQFVTPTISLSGGDTTITIDESGGQMVIVTEGE